MQNSELYYRPSGIAPLKGVLITLLVAIPTALLLGLGYSWCIWKIPFIYIDVILTVALGLILGMITQGLMRLGKIRSTPVSVFMGFIIAAVAIYAKWSEWSVMVDGEIFDAGYTVAQSNILTTLAQPLYTLDRMTLLNETGLWSLHDIEVNGILLWAVWAIEAGIIFFLILACVFRQSRLPFSETGDNWIKGMVSPDLIEAKVTFKEMRQQLEQENFSLLIDGLKTSTTERNWRITFYADDIFGEYYLEIVEQKAVKSGKKITKAEGALMFYSDGKSTGALRISKNIYEKLRGAWGGEMIPAIPWGGEAKTV